MNRLLFTVVCTAFIVLAGIAGYRYGRAEDSSSRYDAGYKRGALDALDEINFGKHMWGDHVAVSLYEDGEPCAVLFVQPDVAGGKPRHLMIRKVGCGAHWNIPADTETKSEDVDFAAGADYIADLLEQSK